MQKRTGTNVKSVVYLREGLSNMDADLAKANIALTQALLAVAERAGTDGDGRIERELRNIKVDLEHEWISPIVQWADVILRAHNLFVHVTIEDTPGHARLVIDTAVHSRTGCGQVIFDLNGPLYATHRHWSDTFARIGA